MGKEIDINETLVKEYVETIRPEDLEIRKQVDIGYRFEKASYFIFEIRPKWDNPEIIKHYDFAKIKFNKTKQLWQLYWMRASLKWESYAPYPTAENIQELLHTINEDEHGCFLG